MLGVAVILKSICTISDPMIKLLTLSFLFRVGAMVDVRGGCHSKDHVNNYWYIALQMEHSFSFLKFYMKVSSP